MTSIDDEIDAMIAQDRAEMVVVGRKNLHKMVSSLCVDARGQNHLVGQVRDELVHAAALQERLRNTFADLLGEVLKKRVEREQRWRNWIDEKLADPGLTGEDRRVVVLVGEYRRGAVAGLESDAVETIIHHVVEEVHERIAGEDVLIGGLSRYLADMECEEALGECAVDDVQTDGSVAKQATQLRSDQVDLGPEAVMLSGNSA